MMAVSRQKKWQAEIERAVDKVKMGVVTDKRRTRTDKSFKELWYRAMIRDTFSVFWDSQCVDNHQPRYSSQSLRYIQSGISRAHGILERTGVRLRHRQ